jgi:hypothetical protein
MATKIFLAPGLLAHIRKSVIEGVQPDELTGRDSQGSERRVFSSILMLLGD